MCGSTGLAEVLRAFAPFLILVALASFVRAQAVPQNSVVNSPHNLSASGRGAIRAAEEQEVCIFCHTPHNSSPIQPLWNRAVPVNGYIPYSSSSLKAKPGQPTGSSKLCLSCHDGTIAVGSVISRNQPIAMAGGITTLPPGHGNLGTDLSDDHPISFRYDATLASQNTKLKAPNALPTEVKLDANQELQCTSCHDAHNNQYSKFMVMDNSTSQLCNACHLPQPTNIVAHTQCSSCHQMHSAPSGAMLLTATNASESCLKCHSGQQQLQSGPNVSADFDKISRHTLPAKAAAPSNVLLGASTDVSCESCHESHSMQTGTASAPFISPKLGRVSGDSIAGGEVPVARYEYEVCFKCHADNAVVAPRISRQVVQNNTRLEFAATAISYHPVTAAGKNADVPSLRQNWTAASLIYCSDCHASESSKAAGGTGANGPHGSNTAPILAGRYDTADNSSESPDAYALCYRCHDRNSILSDVTFTSHKKHIVDLNTPCSVCHDAHGIASAQGTATSNAHLINFDTTIVQPDPVTNKIEYRSLGMRTGSCTLTCHGTAHSPLSYPADVTSTQNLSPLRMPGIRPTPRPLPGRQPVAPTPRDPRIR
jgi:predicted CXXCH cytochrome family protein